MNAAWSRLVLATTTAVAAIAASPAATSAGGDVMKIRALESRYATALVARDLDAVMRVYADAVFIFEAVPPRQIVGARAYREHVQQFLADFQAPFTYDVQDLAVTVVGDVGYGHSIQHLVGVDASGHRVDMTFRITDVYRRIKGDWLIVEEHASFPVDPQTGKADFSSLPSVQE